MRVLQYIIIHYYTYPGLFSFNTITSSVAYCDFDRYRVYRVIFLDVLTTFLAEKMLKFEMFIFNVQLP